MTRFARTRGLKTSTEQIPEDPTPWSQMVAGMNQEPPRMRQVTEQTRRSTEDEEKATSSSEEAEKSTSTLTAINENPGSMVETNDMEEETVMIVTKKVAPKKKAGKNKKLKLSGNSGDSSIEDITVKKKKPKKKTNIKAEQNEAEQTPSKIKKSKKRSQADDLKANEEDTPVVKKTKKKKKNKMTGDSKEGMKEGQPQATEENEYVYKFTKYLQDGSKVRLSKFEGVTVLPEDARRLNQLQRSLFSRGLPEEEVRSVMRQERRVAEKAMKRFLAIVCLRCRAHGHKMAQCPERDEMKDASEICFRCGSADHSAKECTGMTKKNSFDFAQCFVCGKHGHIARQCSDNPRGMYPRGGNCRVCGDVTHLARDCPSQQKRNQEYRVTAERIGGNVEDIDKRPIPFLDSKSNDNKIKKKVVKF